MYLYKMYLVSWPKRSFKIWIGFYTTSCKNVSSFLIKLSLYKKVSGFVIKVLFQELDWILDHDVIKCIWFLAGEDRHTEKVTYAQMYQEVRLYAAALRNCGVEKGDRVSCKFTSTTIMEHETEFCGAWTFLYVFHILYD